MREYSGKAAGLRVSRRQMLGFGAAACVTPASQAFGADQGDPIADLVAEVSNTSRALRDGSAPYLDAAIAASRLPINSAEGYADTASRCAALALRARRLATHAGGREQAETLEILAWDLEKSAALAPFYWMEFPLSYGSSEVRLLQRQFSRPRSEPARGAFLERLRAAPGYLDHVGFRLRGQIERKLTVPAAEATRALSQLKGDGHDLVETLNAIAASSDDGSAAGKAFAQAVSELTRGPVAAGLERVREILEQDYIPRCGETSALAASPEAPAFFTRILGLRHADEANLPALRDAARDRLARVDGELSKMRRDMRVEPDAKRFHQALARDPRWIARDGDEVGARLRAAVEESRALAPSYFTSMPTTPCTVEALPPNLNQLLLNGIYIPPSTERPVGTYFYNTSNLPSSTWVWAKPVMSHELVPGHHYQFARLFEAKDLSPYRKAVYAPAYVEGWGEYARGLMEEAGLYRDDPWGLYASRLVERRFVLRAVAEFGATEPGWDWRAVERDLATDPLTRPGTTEQIALAIACFRSTGSVYWWGLNRFRRLREQATRQAGGRFDARGFHDTVMRGDSAPFSLIEQRLVETRPAGGVR